MKKALKELSSKTLGSKGRNVLDCKHFSSTICYDSLLELTLNRVLDIISIINLELDTFMYQQGWYRDLIASSLFYREGLFLLH